MDRIEEILNTLNSYEMETEPAQHNIWMEVIEILPEYDGVATDAVVLGRNDQFLLRDGTLIRWDYMREAWVAE